MLNRLQYSINITFMCPGKPKNSCESLYYKICFIVVAWNRTHNIPEVCLLCIHAYIHKPEKHPFFNLFINFPTSLYGVGSWKTPWIQASISVSDSKKSSCDSVIHQSATYESIQSAVWIRNGKKATETVSGCGVSIFLSKLSKSGTKFRNAFCSPVLLHIGFCYFFKFVFRFIFSLGAFILLYFIGLINIICDNFIHIRFQGIL